MYAQKEANFWFFGNNAGLNFNTSPPTPLQNGQMLAVEGCGTISDKNGNLLFYTDGMTVWNKNHNVMQNGTGLNGKSSSAQNGLCIKQPGNNSKYFIFSVPEVESNDKGVYYSVVDMSLDNEQGIVVEKNKLFDTRSTEKIAATKHCNGNDVWIVVHGEETVYRAYLLSESGLYTTPVVSYGEIHFVVNSWDASGYMKFSPSGTKLATCHRLSGAVELTSFNNSLGTISNPIPLYFSMQTYGLEFSPSSYLLYVSCGISQSRGELYQVDLYPGKNYLNKQKIAESPTLWYGALQVAPDHKIYLAYMNIGYLGVIQRPNQQGAGCSFQINGINLQGKQSKLGLPGFCQSYLASSKNRWSNQYLCYGSTVKLVNQFPEEGSSYEWSPDDGLSSTTVSDPVASPKSTQTYRVITRQVNCVIDTSYVTVTIRESPYSNAGDDVILCPGKSIRLGSKKNSEFVCTWTPSTFLDNKNSPTPLCTPKHSTQYVLKTTNSYGCSSYDTVLVTVENLNIEVGGDISICKGDSATLIAEGADSYEWSIDKGTILSNKAEIKISPQTTTMYYVKGKRSGCEGFDSVMITVDTVPVIKLTKDTTICMGVSIQLQASGARNYRWEPNIFLNKNDIANPVASPLKTTKYYVYTSNGKCQKKDSVTISVGNNIKLTLMDSTTLCEGSSITLSVQGANSYRWYPDSTLDNPYISNPIASPKKTTTYYVIAKNSGCELTDSITVFVKEKPKVSLSNDTSLCIGDSIQLFANGGDRYMWSPSIGLSDSSISSPYVSPLTTTRYYLTVFEGDCYTTDSVTVTVNYRLPLTLADTVKLCKGNSVQLQVHGGDTYKWYPSVGLSSTIIADPLASPDHSTMYYVEGKKRGCTNVDSIYVEVFDVPEYTISNDTIVCPGSSITLTITEVDSCRWFPEKWLRKIDGMVQVSPLRTTMYYVRAVKNGCIILDSVLIRVNEPFSIILEDSVSLCNGAAVQLNVSGAEKYLWFPEKGLNNSTISNPYASPEQTTKYYVFATRDNCQIMDSVVVFVKDSIKLKLPSDVTICKGESAVLKAEGAESYTWYPPDGLSSTNTSDPVASPEKTTEYTLTTKKGECVSQNKITVNVTELKSYRFTTKLLQDKEVIPGDFIEFEIFTPEGFDSTYFTIGFEEECLYFTKLQTTRGELKISDSLKSKIIIKSFSPERNGTKGIVSFKVLLPANPKNSSVLSIDTLDFYEECSHVIFENTTFKYSPTCAFALRGVLGSEKFSLEHNKGELIINSGLGGTIVVSIYSLTGEKINEFSLDTKASSEYKLPMQKLSTSPYIVNIRNGVWSDSVLLIPYEGK